MPEPSSSQIFAVVEAVTEHDMLMFLSYLESKPGGLEIGSESRADIASGLLKLMRTAARHTAHADSVRALLTRRERQVARLLGSGLTNDEMADEMGCTERTVRAHLTNMQRKLAVHNRTALLASLVGLNIVGIDNTDSFNIN